MALEQFTWDARNIATGEESQRLRSTGYGDGYAQVTGDGINSDTQTWPLTFTGRLARLQPIRDFLKRHRGGKGFAWAPPAGELGIYNYTEATTWKPLGNGLYTLTVTFKTCFHP